MIITLVCLSPEPASKTKIYVCSEEEGEGEGEEERERKTKTKKRSLGAVLALFSFFLLSSQTGCHRVGEMYTGGGRLVEHRGTGDPIPIPPVWRSFDAFRRV